jgi:Protein of unknown function (DUF3800)
MYFCYIDESGTPDIPGNTSHYILAGVSIPVGKWKDCDTEIEVIKQSYGLNDEEIHVAWILRQYPEQNKITGFNSLTPSQRRSQVMAYRNSELLRLQRSGKKDLYRQTKKNYKKTEIYIHLTHSERKSLIRDIADKVSSWDFARLFAECIDKLYFDPTRNTTTIDEQGFEQVVSRFEHYLNSLSNNSSKFGLLVHDNNETVAKKHTLLMKKFHKNGTLWTNLKNIIETPFFVNSELTGMIQIADLCAYAIRRYLENQEEELFDLIFKRADKKGETIVGIRHFAKKTCNCKICVSHKKRIP